MSVHFNELSDIDIQYNRPLYGTEDMYIVIEAESNGIVERDSVKIKPLDYQLEVIVEPDTIAPGDTAIVTVRKKNNDGTITDFDSLQTFEIGMLDGCVLGNIFVGADSGKYFNDVTQPMIFKADANAEVGVVKLRVGLIEQIWGISKSVRGNGNELTAEKEEIRTLKFDRLRKPTANNSSPENIENFCPGVTPSQRIFKDANVTVGGDCSDFPCNEVIIKPSYSFETYPNGSFNQDPCAVEQLNYPNETVNGITSVIWGEINYLEYFKQENFTACYDLTIDKWKFGTNKPLFPYYKVIMDVCLTNITNKGFKPLVDISDISDPTKWNDSNICAAKKDLVDQLPYKGKVRPGGYIFLELTMAHEMSHGQDFQWVIDSLQNSFLYPTLDELEVTCGNYNAEKTKANNELDAKLIYFQYLSKVIMGQKVEDQVVYKGYEDRLFEGYEKHMKQSFVINNKVLDHENYINSNMIVENVYKVLLSEFELIWNCK